SASLRASVPRWSVNCLPRKENLVPPDDAALAELGAQLRKQRKETGLTAQELAQALGWSDERLARIEDGQPELSTVDALNYASLCGLDLTQSLELLAPYREAQAK